MKVLLLATGENNKLSPITDLIPAPMVPVANRPVMEHIVEMLARQGHKQMLVSLQHLPGNIEAHFGAGQRWGIQLDYFLQRDALGSAASLKWAHRALDETFLVVPGDILLDLDVESLLAQHREQGNTATIVVHSVGFAAENALAVDDSGRLLSDPAQPSGATQSWFPTGVFVFEPEVLDFIPSREPFDILTQLIPALMAAGKQVRAHQMQGYWNPLVTLEDHREAQRVLLQDLTVPNARVNGRAELRYHRLRGTQVAQGLWVGRNSTIHPSARLTPPMHIGENCHIGREVELGPDVVIGNNVIIDNGATVCQSTILSYTYVGQFVNIQGRVIRQEKMADIETGESVRIVDPFLLSSMQPDGRNIFLQVRDSLTAFLLLLLSLPLTVPIGVLLWMITGRVFDPIWRVRRKEGRTVVQRMEDVRRFKLMRFTTTRKDGRRTAFTAWLERWGFIRIPELWNVVRGDLAMVGIHPLSPEDMMHVTEPWQEKLREVQPGFTGLWFVQTSRNCDQLELQVVDAYYAATRSWTKDLALLWKTPAAWLRRAREAEVKKDMPLSEELANAVPAPSQSHKI